MYAGQVAEIKKVTLARIICDNRDGIELFSQPPSAFLRADLPGYVIFLLHDVHKNIHLQPIVLKQRACFVEIRKIYR